MSKIITSPVNRWPGTVTLADPLTFPQYFAFLDAIEASREFGDNPMRNLGALMPGICACVEKWELDGLEQLTTETFPASPVKSAMQLGSWLVNEITELLREADEIPNE